MNASELMRRALERSADAEGIRDRFMDNAELYESCFLDFLEEPNIALLRDALARKDYDAAFSAAHALKGVAGNLGLTGAYEAICVLVEALRAHQYDDTDAQCEAFARRMNGLRGLLRDEPPEEEAPPVEQSAPEEKKKKDLFMPVAFCLLALTLLAVGLGFGRVFFAYRQNIKRESAKHLAEISRQLRLYIEESIENDWKTARSVGDSIEYAEGGDDESLFQMLRRKRDLWEVTDLMLLTENGYAVRTDGSVEANDTASEMIDSARDTGETMSIVDSSIIYTVLADTGARYKGSRIVAISAIQSMKTFLDDMGVSAFDGNARIYLTDEKGVVISRLTGENSVPAFNFLALTQGRELTPLAGDTFAGLLDAAESTVFMLDGDEYVVSTPVATRDMPLRLFYIAPEDVINEAMNGFSGNLIVISLAALLLLAGLMAVLFVLMYRARKRRMDAALRARERMFGLLVKNTQTAFALFSMDSPRPAYVSGNVLGITGEESLALFKTDAGYRMRGGDARTENMRLINDALAGWDGKSPFKSDYLRNDKSASPRYFALQLYPVDGSADFVGIAQDVTQAYEREETARNALDMAEKANAAKSRFLSNMSHDIRTPMNAIMNMTYFAIESINDPVRLKEYLDTIRESSDHLLRLINDVLDMSRIEGGQTVLESEPFDVFEEVKRLADILRPLCMAKGQTFITDFEQMRATPVRGDALKFSQIITNLVSNAVKFTPKGGAVRFTAMELPSLREDIAALRLVVEDNGIGISREYIRHIFEPFSRADDSRVSRIEGTGLGLSICHSYVTAMGGTIACESEEGEGSTFTVELFFERSDAPSHETEPALPGEKPFLGMRCLVAEDNETNQVIVKMMLERLGFLTDIASDGGECLRLFRQSPPDYYDIVYMDIQMPVMDGYQAAVAIRECEHARARTVPIVAMTANVFAEDVEKARIAGMDGHIGKPVLSLNLTEETGRVLRRSREEMG